MIFRTAHTNDTYYVPFWFQDQQSGLSDKEYLEARCRGKLKTLPELDSSISIAEILRDELDFFEMWGHIGKLLGLLHIADQLQETRHVVACPTLVGSLVGYLLGITHVCPVTSRTSFASVFDGDPLNRLEVTFVGSIEARNFLFPDYSRESIREPKPEDYVIHLAMEMFDECRFGLSQEYVSAVQSDELGDVCKIDWQTSEELTLPMARSIETRETA